MSTPVRRRFGASAAALALIAASVLGGAVVAAYAADEVRITGAPTQTPFNSPITISGTALVTEPQLAVHVYQVGTETIVCDAGVDDDGGWTCDPFTIGSAGTFQYVAYATQGESTYGENSPPVSIRAYSTTISSPPTPSDDNTPSFAGTGPPDGSAQIDVVTADEANNYAVCTVDSIPTDGAWACGGGVTLPPGDYVGLVTTVDLEGVTSSTSFSGGAPFTVNSPPAASSIDSPADGTLTSDGYVWVSGTVNFGESSGHLHVEIAGSPDEYCDEDFQYYDEPTWSCFLNLANKTNVITATTYLTDPGNNSTRSITVTRMYKPSVTYVVGPTSISATPEQTFSDSTLATEWAQAHDNGEGFNRDQPAATCAGEVTCTTPSTPGIWSAYTTQAFGGVESTYLAYVLVPEAPTLAAIVNADRTVTLLGTGTIGEDTPESTPRYDIYIQNAGGQTVCSPTTVSATGFWTCTFAPPAGNYTYRAYQVPVDWEPGSGDIAIPGQSAFSGAVSVIVPIAPAVNLVPPVTPAPTGSPTPAPKPTSTPAATPIWNPETFEWTFVADADGYHPGDPVTLMGAGLPPAALVKAEIHSTPVHLGTTIARQNGTFILNVVIPPDTPAGTHEFWVTITPVGGGTSTVVQPAKITIVGGPGGPGAGEDDGGGGVPGAFGSDRDDPGAPSSFTHGITTFSHLVVNPIAVAIAGGIGLALLLLVAFPAELLNSTLESQYDRFSKVLPKVRVPWWSRFADWVDKTPLFSASLMTVAAAIIFGFADPGFGFDITSFRVVLGCFIALFIVGYLASIISGRILGRAWGFDTILEVKPLTLILTVIGVVISRLLDFSPGFLIGLLLGMALVGKRSKGDEAKSTLVQTGVVFVMALLAWTAYSILSVTTTPDTFGSTLVFDTLVAITTEGLTALFIGLLPLKFLDGQGLFNFSKLLWAAVYAVIAFAFVVIVIPAADNWGDGGGSIGLWLTIVGLFAAVCIGIYLYFRFWAKPMPADEDEAEAPKPELVETK